MKKLIAVLFVGAVLLMSGCNQDIAVIGGADGPTAIIVSDGKDDSQLQSVPARVEHEYTYNDDEFCSYTMTLRAYGKNDALMWEYTTPKSFVAQCESLEYLGMENGLVYVNENGLFDEEKMRDGNVEITSRLRALNAADGTVAWDNIDYSGAGTCCVFDPAGDIYVAGYFGPDCMKIDRNGKTIWSVPGVDEELYWVYDLSLDDGIITISYEVSDATVRLSVDGEILN